MPDYTLVFEPRPEQPPRGKPGRPLGYPGNTELTALGENLVAVSKKPGTPGRIVVYDTAHTARTIAGELRNGRKQPNRPVGQWTFETGQTEDGRFGIWATYRP